MGTFHYPGYLNSGRQSYRRERCVQLETHSLADRLRSWRAKVQPDRPPARQHMENHTCCRTDIRRLRHIHLRIHIHTRFRR